MFKKYIDEIVASRDNAKMVKLEDLILSMANYIKEKEKSKFDAFSCELYEIANGKMLTQEKAEHIIKNMSPYGMKWNLEQTEQVRKQNGFVNIKPIDFWIVMNMAYNDYHDIFDDDVNLYASYSKNFIEDDDAVPDKVYIYFTRIPLSN